MRECDCTAHHGRKRIVLTGGPGAGKTAVLELARQYLCEHVVILPEAASMLFHGGFPRSKQRAQLAAAQRAIYHVQRELENAMEADDKAAVVLCDRGTVDGSAYWPGPGTLWSEVGSTHQAELGRYDVVLHLRTPADGRYSTHTNPARIESASEAAHIDALIAEAWADHPHRFEVPSKDDFFEKAHDALDILLTQLPACCARRPSDRPHNPLTPG